MLPKTKRSLGRYDRVAEAAHPGPDLPRSSRATRGRIEIVQAAVPDPNPILGEKLKRQRVAINRLTDPLECERSFSRISEPAYLAGRAYMRVVEMAARSQSKPAFEPGDGGGSHDLAIGYAIERAAVVVEMQNDVARHLGSSAAFLLRLVLSDGHTLDQVAAVLKIGKRRARSEFRDAIESLAVHFDRSRWPN